MRFSFSTNAFTRFSVFEAVEKIAAAGYDGVELLADAPHLYADWITEADIEQLREVLDRTGVRVANINANTASGYYGRALWEPVFEPSLANPEKSEREWRIAYTRKCIDMAQALGSPNVSVTSGRMVPGVSPEESRKLLRESLAEVLDYAGEKGVRVGMEYEPGLLVECGAELRELIDAVGSPVFGANIDMGHSNVLGEKPEEIVPLLAPAIFHTHIEDIRGRKHYHLIPGEGDVDFGTIFKELARSGYDGFLTVELYTCPDRPEEAADLAIRHLKPILQQFGRIQEK